MRRCLVNNAAIEKVMLFRKWEGTETENRCPCYLGFQLFVLFLVVCRAVVPAENGLCVPLSQRAALAVCQCIASTWNANVC
jgi:hypothetical protein